MFPLTRPGGHEGSTRYEAAGEACDTLSEAVDGLEDIVTSLCELASG